MRQAEIETWSGWALPTRVAQAERCARIAGTAGAGASGRDVDDRAGDNFAHLA